MAANEVDESDDLAVLRWAHRRLGEMGYELTDEDDEEHPLGWWEAQRASDWAHALEIPSLLRRTATDENLSAGVAELGSPWCG